MHFVYIDDSGDEKTRCFSGLVVPAEAWKATLRRIVDHRRALKSSDGVLVTVELHATEFVGGRGRISPQRIMKDRRAQMFANTLQMLAALPDVRLFNAIAPRHAEKMLVERLITRINNTMKAWRSQAVIVHDEGKDYTNLVRKMSVYNPVASRYGGWDDGKLYRNFPTDYILEDIFFRDSKRSQFIQILDFCSYALFRSEFPLASKQALGINDAFRALEPLCIREAFGTDRRRLGIIRC